MTMKPSQVLRETDVNQIQKQLIRFNVNGEMEGKCALGVLACESGKEELKLDRIVMSVDWDKILEAYGVTEMDGYPYLNTGSSDWAFDLETSLPDIIISLNDGLRFSFKEIAEFLEVTFDL